MKHALTVLGLAALAALAFALSTCDGPAPPPGQPTAETRLGVAASLPPLAYFTERIGGDRVAVQVLLPPGAEPHTFEPGVGQLAQLGRAQVGIMVGEGLPLENQWFAAVRQTNPKLVEVNCSAGVPLIDRDPHIWLAPSAVKIMARSIAEGLTRADPDHTQDYASGLESFLREIEELDTAIRQQFDELRGRQFLVYHSAWRYFARDYGLTELAIEKEGREPDARALAETIEQARAAGLRTVFIEPQYDAAMGETVARELGGQVARLDPLARDWASNLREMSRLLSQEMR